MSESFFGLHKGHLASWADKIAAKHGASHTNHIEPCGEKQGWFSCQNRGEPFDSQTADVVIREVAQHAHVQWSSPKAKRIAASVINQKDPPS